ncbi:MAG: RdgB/HAM1 family non-canonical purine NTP pyrophosphatase [Acidobacteria bacterium]|nr:RdgB/HAM1 family non-canonical purine NTP pyrophosphatase [Acidobacteriota bacterium]
MTPLIYLASNNPGKLREFAQAATAWEIEVQILPGIDNLPACIEDGDTFEANARKKALYYSQFTETPVFADDSGLCVDALGGAPGVFSARFAGLQADDEANNQKLINELAQFPQDKRSAHYICVIALAERGQILTVVEGRADGLIQEQPCGSGGFGYDPYFFYPPLEKTFAQLSVDEKFNVSHRGEAFRKLLGYVQSEISRI